MSDREQQIIARLRREFNPRNLVSGIGDDAAVIPARGAGAPLVTLDTLCEGTHFEPGTPPKRLGHKLAAVSLSDVAAMGGRAEALFVSLAVPSAVRSSWIRALYAGIAAAAAPFGVRVAGGDTVRAATTVLSSVCVGRILAGKALRRAGARPGDRIYATGFFGYAFQTGHHLNFTPRLKEIAWLRSRAVIRALTDASDGAARAVELLTRERGLGAEIRLDALLVRGRARPGLEDVRHALFDGEDFELVFAAPRMDRGVVERFHKRFTLPLSEIGRVSARKGIRFTWRGGRVRFRGRPYAHF